MNGRGFGRSVGADVTVSALTEMVKFSCVRADTPRDD
jgi:hypothetical protein